MMALEVKLLSPQSLTTRFIHTAFRKANLIEKAQINDVLKLGYTRKYCRVNITTF